MRTVAELTNAYVSGRFGRAEIGAQTYRNDRSILHNFAVAVGAQRDIGDVTTADIEAWQATIGHLAAATRRARFSVARTFFAWAVRRGHIIGDPMLDLRAPRQPRTVPRALAAGQVTRIIDTAGDARGRLMTMLMVQEGLRCCEVANLEMGDVDRCGRRMRIRGKGGHERILPISAETLEALTDYLDERPGGAGPLLRSYKRPGHGLCPDTVSGIVGDVMRRSGVKRRPRDGVSAHALRHTAATDMLLGGAHLRDVQAALGHAHLATTEVYLPLVVHGLEAAMGGRRYGRRRLASMAG